MTNNESQRSPRIERSVIRDDRSYETPHSAAFHAGYKLLPFHCENSNQKVQPMTKQEKLLASLRNNPKAIRFDDACKIAEQLGFSRQGGKGSHRTYGRMDEPLLLNFQNRGGYVLPYQAKQLIDMVDKYADLSD